MTGASAVVIGAGGGIGGALVEALRGSGGFDRIHALSRRLVPAHGIVQGGFIDVTDERCIIAAARRIDEPVALVIVATGILHESGRLPEKSLRELDPAILARAFAVNTIGPALVLKHFTPLLAKDRRSIVAMLSARVGSISDNRTGGWYGYRASKSALNMVVKTAAIELARTRPRAICVALHPGTVETSLSAPFKAGIPAHRLFQPDRAARQLIDVVGGLTPQNTGRIFAWDGAEIDP